MSTFVQWLGRSRRPNVAQMKRNWGAVALTAAALATGGLVSWIAAAGDVALGDTVTGTTGDISYSVTWTQGPGTNQTTLVVKNAAAPGGQTISDFVFQINAAGVDVTGVSGGGCSTNDFAHDPLPPGEIECGQALAPGDSVTITITTSSPVATGTTGSITFSDNGENQQPVVNNIPLQGGTSSGTGTGGGTTTGTTTTPTGATPPHCDWVLSPIKVSTNPPGPIAVGVHWAYRGSVSNGGNETCPRSTLEVSISEKGLNGIRLAPLPLNRNRAINLDATPGKPLQLSVPALPPGATIAYAALTLWEIGARSIYTLEGGSARVVAEMPLDFDGGPPDEIASTTTLVRRALPRGEVPVGLDHTAKLPFDCAGSAGICRVFGDFDTGSCHASPGDPCAGQGSEPCATTSVCHSPRANASRAQLGTVTGSVHAGKTGELTVRLNPRGRLALLRTHRLSGRLELTIGVGGFHGFHETLASALVLTR